MDTFAHLTNFELLTVIVNYGQGSKVLKVAKEQGVKGGTMMLAKGTYRKPILQFLELTDVRKEMVWMIIPHQLVNKTMYALDEKFRFDKPNHGILFVIPISSFLGLGDYSLEKIDSSGGNHMTTYNAIFTIVDKGNAEDVVDVATQAGAKGATIINARGSGIHETSKLFNMEVEQEKEIILILAEHSILKDIVSSIREKFNIDEPGKGIIFVQEVHQTMGIR